MPSDDRHAKWEGRYRDPADHPVQAAQVLRNNAFLLPRQGKALDLACGRGGNALFLAQQGLTVSAWDYAQAAIEPLRESARADNLAITAEVRDVEAVPPGPASFDVICVSYFLERSLVPAIMAALRPGGLLFYETFVREAVTDNGPTNMAFRLAPNELLRLFDDLLILEYREYGRVGDLARGQRDVATLVAQQPAR